LLNSVPSSTLWPINTEPPFPQSSPNLTQFPEIWMPSIDPFQETRVLDGARLKTTL